MNDEVMILALMRLGYAEDDAYEYGDIVVRVAGYSAYLIEQSPRGQEYIIERTEHC